MNAISGRNEEKWVQYSQCMIKANCKKNQRNINREEKEQKNLGRRGCTVEKSSREQPCRTVIKKHTERRTTMKKISIMIPCYNEEENVVPISEAVIDILTRELPQYDYEILFIDNDSKDNTRPLLRKLCASNPKIRAIFNAKNFGQFNSPYYGMLQTTGDCVICMVCDFQDPVELIPTYVHEWENGYRIVIGIKTSSQENKLMYWLRTCYYKMIKKLSNVEQIEHFTGSGLYDRSFVEILRKLDDPTPFLRGIVAELGYKRKEIPYEQPKRRAGKTKNNFFTLFDAAMLSVTSYTKAGLRLATLFGGVCSIISILVGMIYLVMKLVYWDRFPAGMAPVLIGMCFLGSVQIFFIGLVGEYIMSINARVMKRPLVVEEERLNFENDSHTENRSFNSTADVTQTAAVDTAGGVRGEGEGK